jgi:hypothetical protein
VSWALTPQGASVEGAPAEGTAGEPTTVRNIWKRYGDLCSASAKRYGVPVELVEGGARHELRRALARRRAQALAG